jgi:hypothetical protein
MRKKLGFFTAQLAADGTLALAPVAAANEAVGEVRPGASIPGIDRQLSGIDPLAVI